MNKDIKIAFVTPYLSTGGAERALINIASHLYKQHLNVQLVAATVVNGNACMLPAGLKVVDFKNESPLDSPAFYKNTKALVHYLKNEKPDVVVCTSDYLNIALIFARFFCKHKFKIIVSQQVHATSYLKELPWINRQFISWIQKRISKNADLLIGASKGVVEDFSLRYQLKSMPHKMRTIYNPVYEDKIVHLAAERTQHPAFDQAGIKLVTVGRLVKQKDHATLLHAFKLLLEKIPSAQLFIIGVGAEQRRLESIIADLNIKSSVWFLGYKKNSYSYVAKCDLFVLSSEYEGFGNVVVEALATGVNVVSTDCPSGPAEILNNGEFGVLCKPGHPGLLCDAILSGLKNKLPAATLHKRATEFSINNIAEKYLDAIDSVID